MLARLLDAGVAPGRRLRVCLVGGAALPGALAERALAADWPLCPTYGMSEVASQAATLVNATPGWRPGTVGVPLDGLEIALTDGRIRVRGDAVMLGYANPEMRPGDGLVDGWYETGDLGEWDGSDRLVVLGRADDVLISGGENVHPQTVEEVASRCPGVRAVGVTACADTLWGDRLVAAVVGDVSEDAVLGWCRERLPPAFRPKQVVMLKALPLNASGKLDRRELRRLLAE
jgi:O-succinylbenzoic acid--CoA ligase